ncbi:MAG TPA: hypothetical protein VIG30_09625 [Ktedonobacterales bacterium]
MAASDEPGDEPGDEPDKEPEEPSTAARRQERLDALSALARQGGVAPDAPVAAPAQSLAGVPASPPTRPRGPARRRIVVGATLGALVVVVAVGAALRFALAPRTTTAPRRQQPTSVTLTPRADHLDCPVDVAWSPDGKQIAMLGYKSCDGGPPDGTNPGQVNIYDATTGQLVTQFAPDALVLQNTLVSLAPPNPPIDPQYGPVTPYIRYQTLLWSPDGTHLAMPFFVEDYSYFEQPPFTLVNGPFGLALPTNPVRTSAGILITGTTGGQPRVIAAPYQQNIARMEWDLSSGTLISSALTLTPALGYQWGAGGKLLAQSPISTTAALAAPPPGPVGNASGDSSFSIWQPGEAAPGYMQGDTSVALAPNLYLWESHFAAWSPDGRYLITPGYTGGRAVLAGRPAPTASTLSATGNTATPLLAPRDAAMSTLYAGMGPTASGEAPAAQFAAWRPDGRVVATTAEPYFGQTAAEQLQLNTTVMLYDSGSGQVLATLKPRAQLTETMNSSFTLQFLWLKWSPDGTHLLLLDNVIGTLTIWGPGALPK